MPTQQLKSDPRIFFAGQITGVEGYVESAASGFLAGIAAAQSCSREARFRCRHPKPPWVP